ncbi:MAG TPA: ABC transporter substrate-binding protein [Acidimicrobiales bacterium]|nr:ABC transporter substrate-binding protein [Acidimicrobiales bacterium]
MIARCTGRAVAALVATALLAACGGGGASTESAASPGGGLPVTLTDDTGTAVTVTSIERIVPVDGDLAEIVFALGLGDNVAAVDLSATYPPATEEILTIGYQRALATEPILAVEPTVVLATDLAGPDETLAELRELGVPVVVIERDRTLAGPADKIRAVADALGVPERGAELADQVDADIAAARELLGEPAERPRVATLYLRGETLQLVFGEGSGVDAVIAAAGGIDVGTELGVVDNAALSTEALLAAAPDVFLVSTTGLESVGGEDGFWALPGFDRTPAFAERRLVVRDDQYLFGGGPRTGELLADLIDQFHPDLPGDAAP